MCGECRCAHDRDGNVAKAILSREGVSLVRARERVIATARAGKPDTASAQGRQSACRGGGMSTSRMATFVASRSILSIRPCQRLLRAIWRWVSCRCCSMHFVAAGSARERALLQGVLTERLRTGVPRCDAHGGCRLRQGRLAARRPGAFGSGLAGSAGRLEFRTEH